MGAAKHSIAAGSRGSGGDRAVDPRLDELAAIMLQTLPRDVRDRHRPEVVEHGDEGNHAEDLERDHHEGHDLHCVPLGAPVRLVALVTAAAPVEGVDARDVVQLVPARTE